MKQKLKAPSPSSANLPTLSWRRKPNVNWRDRQECDVTRSQEVVFFIALFPKNSAHINRTVNKKNGILHSKGKRIYICYKPISLNFVRAEPFTAKCLPY